MKYNVEMLEGKKERKSIPLNCFHKERKDKENARHRAASENRMREILTVPQNKY